MMIDVTGWRVTQTASTIWKKALWTSRWQNCNNSISVSNNNKRRIVKYWSMWNMSHFSPVREVSIIIHKIWKGEHHSFVCLHESLTLTFNIGVHVWVSLIIYIAIMSTLETNGNWDKVRVISWKLPIRLRKLLSYHKYGKMVYNSQNEFSLTFYCLRRIIWRWIAYLSVCQCLWYGAPQEAVGWELLTLEARDADP